MMPSIKVSPLMWIYLGICFYFHWFKESLVGVGVILCHEMAHFVVAKYYDYEVGEITLYPFGAFLRIEDYGMHPNFQDLWVASAGALSHFFIFGVGYLCKGMMGAHLYQHFLIINFRVLFFNLLPIYPLDGGKILLCLLSYFLDYLVSLKCCLVLSFFWLMMMIIFLWNEAYVVVYIFLMIQLYLFSQNYYYLYLKLISSSLRENLKIQLHTRPIFLKNRYNCYLWRGQILDEKSFIKSRFFIDNRSF